MRNLITGEERQIGELETELQNKRNEALNFQTLLEDLEKNKEASSLLVDTNSRLASLKAQKEQAQKVADVDQRGGETDAENLADLPKLAERRFGKVHRALLGAEVEHR